MLGSVQSIAGKLLSMPYSALVPCCACTHCWALSCAHRTTLVGKVPTGDALLPAAAARACLICLIMPCGLHMQLQCSSRRGVNRWPNSGRVLYACAPRYSKDVALRTQCMRNAERNRAPLSRLLGCTMNCMAGADREPFPLPWKACMPMQMTVL